MECAEPSVVGRQEDLVADLKGQLMARAARNLSIDPTKIQIVHVWNRCVRRAYLCGTDDYSGRSYEHRRGWARKRLQHLASCFAIDCITYAIMSNHTHQILRSRPDIVAQWDDRTVARKWLRISLECDIGGNPLEPSELKIQAIINDPAKVRQLRSRLSDVSWWMRYFSHYMACRSNREDEISGHFWESRFGSEVLESEAATITCMIYVDLNPVRAQMAATPEESDYTGAKDRIDDLRISLGTAEPDKQVLNLNSSTHSIHDWERLDNKHSGWMSPIEIDERYDSIGTDEERGQRRASRKGITAMSLVRYLQLLDWTGRAVRSGKPGIIPIELHSILTRLGLTERKLLNNLWSFGAPPGQSFPTVGPVHLDLGNSLSQLAV